MPSDFIDDLVNGDVVEAVHVNQFGAPVNNLETGATWYREATNTGNAYKVAFATGNVVPAYTKGLIVHFKASADNTSAATLTITGPSGDLTAVDLKKAGGDALAAGDISSGQVIAAVYTEDAGATNKRFEIIGGRTSPVAIADGGTGATTAVMARTNLSVQAQDDTLDEISTLSMTKGDMFVHNGSEVTKLMPGTNGQVLSADSMEISGLKWVTGGGGGGGATELNDLSDVAIASPSTGQVIRYDGTDFVNATLEINDVDGLSAAIATAGGTLDGHLAELQALSLSEGDMLIVDSGGELQRIAAGADGDVLQIVSGVPAWGEPVGGGGGGDLLVNGLVAFGTRYAEITSTSDNLTSSAFTPVSGKKYLIRWIANHSSSVDQLNLATAITNSQPHFCRAKETGSSTTYNIGFSGGAFAYTCAEAQRTRTHEFVWTATTNNEVQILLGQPSLTYGEFTGTLLVYEVKDEAANLGWGTFGSGYRWLNSPSVTANSLSGGSYKTGVSLNSSKTYAFIGSWCQGYSLKLVLKQGSNYWRLPPNSDAFVSAAGADNAWSGGTYYENTYSASRGEFIRLFSPPSTGTFDLGCCLYAVQSGCFWLIELP